MRNKTILFVVVLLISAALLSACGPSLAAQPVLAQSTEPTPAPRSINVTGEGKVYITPDIANVMIGVHTEGKDAAAAVAANNAQSQKVADALKTFKIDPKDIQTTNISIYPQQQTDNTGKPLGINYVVDNTVYVTLRDISKLGDMLDAVVKAGANTINSVQFDVADRSAALTQARTAAVKDAQSQAQELANAAGATLGDVRTLSTYGVTPPVPMYDVKAAAGVGGGSSVPVSAGQLVIVVDVNAVYDIK
jgi:uncharacterized protein YggE